MLCCMEFWFIGSSRWWQLKYVLFSSRTLGKIPILTGAYFSKWVVQPPTRKTPKVQKLLTFFRKKKAGFVCFCWGCTLPKTNIAPENRVSQEESHLPTSSIFRCELAVSFREGKADLAATAGPIPTTPRLQQANPCDSLRAKCGLRPLVAVKKGGRLNLSNEKKPGWLGCIVDYTTQLFREYSKPL